MTTIPAPTTAFEVRFDALVTRMRSLARVAGGGSIGNELLDLADEMVRVRRDMAYFVERAAAIPVESGRNAVTTEKDLLTEMGEQLGGTVTHVPPRRPYATRGTGAIRGAALRGGSRGGANKGIQKIRGTTFMPPPGKRWCANHDNGEGAMLDIAEFKVKSPATGQYKSWCEPCSRDYQQRRYVRVGYKRVTVEVRDGDACLGHICPRCDKPFEVGQRIQGENVAHESCYG